MQTQATQANAEPQGLTCHIAQDSKIFMDSTGRNSYNKTDILPLGFCPVVVFQATQNEIPEEFDYSSKVTKKSSCLFDTPNNVVYYVDAKQKINAPLRSISQFNRVCPSAFTQLVKPSNTLTDKFQATSDMSNVTYDGLERSVMDFNPDQGYSPEQKIIASGDVVYTRGSDNRVLEINGISNQCRGMVDPKVQEGKPLNQNSSTGTKTFIYDDATNIQLIVDRGSQRLYFNIVRGNGQVNQCSVPITSNDSKQGKGQGCNPERYVRAHAINASRKQMFSGCVVHAALECSFGDSPSVLTLMHTYQPGKYTKEASLLDSSGDAVQFRNDVMNDGAITTVDNIRPGGNDASCNKIAAINGILDLGTVYFYSDLY